MLPIVVKICGLTTLEIAMAAVDAGADFIGLVFHKASRRYVSPETAKVICAAIKHSKANVVGVFTTHNAAEISTITQHTGITTVQLHGVNSRNAIIDLPSSLRRIYTISVSKNGKIIPENCFSNIDYLIKNRDFLLFDNAEPGSGSLLPLTNANGNYGLPFFVAGGLNTNNVQNIIRNFAPPGVDVSSGVENCNGKKDAKLISNFIKAVKGGIYDND